VADFSFGYIFPGHSPDDVCRPTRCLVCFRFRSVSRGDALRQLFVPPGGSRSRPLRSLVSFFTDLSFFLGFGHLCSDLICGQVRPHDIGSVAECSWILSPVSSVLLVRKQARRLDFLSFSRFGFSFTALHRTASLIDFCFSPRVWCHERICCELRFPRAIFRDLFSFASAGDCRSLILVPVRSPIRVRVFDLDDFPTEACY
jgi:hypothetical protein